MLKVIGYPWSAHILCHTQVYKSFTTNAIFRYVQIEYDMRVEGPTLLSSAPSFASMSIKAFIYMHICLFFRFLEVCSKGSLNPSNVCISVDNMTMSNKITPTSVQGKTAQSNPWLAFVRIRKREEWLKAGAGDTVQFLRGCSPSLFSPTSK